MDHGDIVLARVGPSLVFRRFRPRGSANGEAFELVAMNQDFAPIWSDRADVGILAVMVEHHKYRRVGGAHH
ncbi:MAG TPA: hypothetical protein PKV98_04365 [Burkholderiaceae bacterium]|nr:hypothetical protein [Burkholderiaceae bacterium]